jgi:hypothetical protein
MLAAKAHGANCSSGSRVHLDAHNHRLLDHITNRWRVSLICFAFIR